MNNTFNIIELAQYLRIDRQTAYKLVRSKKIKSINISNGKKNPHYRIRMKDLEEFLKGAKYG